MINYVRVIINYVIIYHYIYIIYGWSDWRFHSYFSIWHTCPLCLGCKARPASRTLWSEGNKNPPRAGLKDDFPSRMLGEFATFIYIRKFQMSKCAPSSPTCQHDFTLLHYGVIWHQMVPVSSVSGQLLMLWGCLAMLKMALADRGWQPLRMCGTKDCFAFVLSAFLQKGEQHLL